MIPLVDVGMDIHIVDDEAPRMGGAGNPLDAGVALHELSRILKRSKSRAQGPAIW